MKQFGIELTNQAEIDLEEIWDSIAIDNPTAADKLTRALEERMYQLKYFPEIGISKPDIHIKYRQLVEGRYIILYEIIDV